MSKYIKRKFRNTETNEECTEDCLTLPNSMITVLLGEPASGKTYQLKKIAKDNSKSYFIELVNLLEDEVIKDDIDNVLIDSIDEALIDFNNPKKLQRKLVNFITKYQNKNPNVKFIISCRFGEWNEYFKESLREIDNKINIYNFLSISKENINELLSDKDINNDNFWNFIEKNYLELLLENILIITYLIENFDNYDRKNISYIEIYQEIAKKYLSQIGKDRVDNSELESLDRLLLITSSLATYMTFNRLSSIDDGNLNELASNLYKIDGKEILAKDLRIVLNRSIFKKSDKEFSFFHKSIQEYLVAYFLAKKNLSAEDLKGLLSSELRFYEEFEEIVVYLTNINKSLFDDFVGFDPFIFKRHPFLIKEQQEKLLLSVLNKYKIDNSQIWGRWESFQNTTLVNFPHLDNLVDILKKSSSLKEHGFYLMKLLENNYSEIFKNFMLDLFKQNLLDIDLIKDVVKKNFIDNYDFNVKLYEFMEKNNLLEKDEHSLYMSFEVELFSLLYGIKYKFKYGEERFTERTDISFLQLLPLLNFIPTESLKYIAPYLLKNDADEWFKDFLDNIPKDSNRFEYINWVIFAVLKHCTDGKELKTLLLTLQEKDIFIHFVDKKEISLDFEKIADSFWKLYFAENIFKDYQIQELTSFYSISSDFIKKAMIKYPIEKYIEKYVYFSSTHKLLGEHPLIQNYLLETKKRSAEYHKKQEKDREQRNPKLYQEAKEQKKLRKLELNRLKKLQDDALKNFATDQESFNDVYNLFYLTSKKQHGEWLEVDRRAKELLEDKYMIFLERLKEIFNSDVTYKEIQKTLTSNSLSNSNTFIFQYLFEVIDKETLRSIIKTENDYKKFFWHMYRGSLNELPNVFVDISQNYFDCFCSLSLETLRLSFDFSEKKKIGHYNLLIKVFKKLNKFDYLYLKHIIEYIKKNDVLLEIEESYEKDYLLEILALDKDAYSYVLTHVESKKVTIEEYLKFLLRVDTKNAIEYFFNRYKNIKRKKSLWIRAKNRVTQNIKTLNEYDRFEINPKKIECYQVLIYAIKKSKINLDLIDIKYIEDILIDYYSFFNEYKTPKSIYTPDSYDDIYMFINNIWKKLENDKKYTEILQKLSNLKNKNLSNMAKYTLTRVYEEQRKSRNYSNSYYKKVFDNNNNEIKQEYQLKKDESIFTQWWFISLVVAFIGGLITFWQFNTYIGLLISIVLFIIMLAFNPKRRFFRLGMSSFIVMGLQFIPLKYSMIIPKNNFIYGYIKSDNGDIPWFGILMFIASMFLFWLDYKENKNDN